MIKSGLVLAALMVWGQGAVKDEGKPGQFYDAKLGLHFSYPVEMNVKDMRKEMEEGHANIYGKAGQEDSEHLDAARCMLPMLDADLPAEKGPQRVASLDGVWVDDPAGVRAPGKADPIFAKILMVEVVKDCLPKELQANENDALGTIAMSFVSEPGIHKMPKPLWFEVGGLKLHMNSGAGRPVVNGVVGAPVFIMSMSTAWKGHLLAWVFTSNDKQVFNEITKSMVQFGDGKWDVMFPANIGEKGEGTPMKVLPK